MIPSWYKHQVIGAFLLAGSILLILNVTTGTYFESYELLIQQFVSGIYTDKPYGEWCTDMDFLLIPIYTRIDTWFMPGYGYAFAKTLLNFFWLSALIYLLLYEVQTSKKLKQTILLAAMLFLLVIEHLLIVNNVRISIMLLLSGYLLLNQNPESVLRRTFAALLICMGILARIDVGLVITFLALAFHLIFQLRTSFKLIVFAAACALSVYILYDFQMKNRDDFIAAGHQYEREILDKQNFGSSATGTMLSEQQKVKLQAMSYFIYDEGVIKPEDYQEAVSYPGLLNYILNNPAFPKILSHKWSSLMSLLAEKYGWLLSLLFLTSILLSFHMGKSSQKGMITRFAIFSAAYVLVPLIIMVMAEMPERFLGPYLGAAVMISLITIHRLQEHSYIWLIMPVFVALFLCQGSTGLKKKWQNFQYQSMEADKFKDCITTLHSKGETPVLYGIDFESTLYPRLFCSGQVSGYYVMEYFYLSYYDHVVSTNKRIFGEEYASFLHRIEFLARKKLIFLSQPAFNDFITDYLRLIHQTEVSFIPTEGCEELGLESYRIQINQ